MKIQNLVTVSLILIICFITFNSVAKSAITNLDLNYPEGIKQGNTLIVTAKTDNEPVNPRIIFNGKKIKFFKTPENTYQALIGTTPLTKKGDWQLKTEDDTGSFASTQNIKVISGRFSTHNVEIINGIEPVKQTKQEKKITDEAINTVSNKKYATEKSFILPAKGKFTVRYGVWRYINNRPTGIYHNGLDIKAPVGTTVVASADGKVLLAQSFFRRGNLIAIDHGHGLVSTYLHLSKILVSPGQMVKQGEKIGELGHTGFTTQGSIVHWGVYVNGVPVNPEQWLK